MQRQPRRTVIRSVPFSLASMLVLACNGADAGRGFEVLEEGDSRTVLNHAPELPAGSWTVSAEPSVEIGEVEGEEPYLFQRITHAHTRSDGSILVVDGGASSIRIYSPDGTHIRSAGRAGAGPGEFRNVIAVRRLPGDTIALTEFPGSRISFFDENGAFVSTWTAPALPGPAWFLSTDRFMWDVSPRASPDEEAARETRHLVLGTRAGIGADTVAQLAGSAAVSVREGNMMSIVRVPFVEPDVALLVPPATVISSGEGYELVFRSLDDTAVTRSRIGRELRPVTQESWRRARDIDIEGARRMAERTGRSGDAVRAREKGYDLISAPSHMPAFAEIRSDAAGMIWARDYVAPGDTVATHEWFVVDATGRWVTSVAVPAGIQILEIGERHILARTIDDLGVQRLQVLDLTRTPRP